MTRWQRRRSGAIVGVSAVRVLPGEDDLKRAADILNAGSRVAILAGAGLSNSSGFTCPTPANGKRLTMAVDSTPGTAATRSTKRPSSGSRSARRTFDPAAAHRGAAFVDEPHFEFTNAKLPFQPVLTPNAAK